MTLPFTNLQAIAAIISSSGCRDARQHYYIDIARLLKVNQLIFDPHYFYQIHPTSTNVFIDQTLHSVRKLIRAYYALFSGSNPRLTRCPFN